MASNHDYRLTFRREGWKKDQQRLFSRGQDMRTNLRKLLASDRDDLRPVVSLHLERRPVGEWSEAPITDIPEELWAAYAEKTSDPERMIDGQSGA